MKTPEDSHRRRARSHRRRRTAGLLTIAVLEVALYATGRPDEAPSDLSASGPSRSVSAAFQDGSMAGSFDVVEKHLASDLVANDDFAPTSDPVLEKLEGLAVLSDGPTLIVNDNDGTEGCNGETQLLSLGTICQ